jgi:SH3-like domain-containing protein
VLFFLILFCFSHAEVPRFVALRSSKVNMHVGPGKHYPISWQYQCPHLPVEVVAEFEDWRFVRDHDGIKGWIHRSLLTGRRFARLFNSQMLYLKPNKKFIAYGARGAIGKILLCNQSWCRLEFLIKNKKIKAWAKRSNLWGIYPKESF